MSTDLSEGALNLDNEVGIDAKEEMDESRLEEEAQEDLEAYKKQFTDAAQSLEIGDQALEDEGYDKLDSTKLLEQYKWLRDYALRCREAVEKNKKTIAMAMKAAVDARLKHHEYEQGKTELRRFEHDMVTTRKRLAHAEKQIELERKSTEEWKQKYYDELEVELELEEAQKEKEEMKEMYETLLNTERKRLEEVRKMLLSQDQGPTHRTTNSVTLEEHTKRTQVLHEEIADWKRKYLDLQAQEQKEAQNNRVRSESIIEIIDSVEEDMTTGQNKLSALEKLKAAKAGGGMNLRNRLQTAREELRRNRAYIEQKDLLNKRLRIARKQLRDMKAANAQEIKRLKLLLIDTQSELAELKGEMAKRKNLISSAQTLLGHLKPWVGIEIPKDSSNDEVAEDGSFIVKVLNVKSGSPAETGGLRKLDIIEMVDDEEIQSSDDLREVVHSVLPGDKLTFELRRQHDIELCTVYIGSKNIDFGKIVDLRRVAAGIIRKGDDALVGQLKRDRAGRKKLKKRNSGK